MTAKQEYFDFSIAVSYSRGKDYPYLARAFEGLTSGEPLAVGCLPSLIDKLQWIAEMEKRIAQMEEPASTLAAMEELGGFLFSWLVRDNSSIYDAFIKQVRKLEGTDDKRLRVRLSFVPWELQGLPWECMWVPEWGEEVERAKHKKREPSLPARIHSPFLCQNASIAIVRQILDSVVQPELAIAEPLRVMLVYCNPKTQFIERLKEMLNSTLTALEPLCTEGLVALKVLHEPTPDEVIEMLLEENPHVLITLCHGYEGGRGGWILSDGRGGIAPLEVSRLVATLQRMKEESPKGTQPRLRAAFLPECLTAKSAPHLLRAGVSAVLAMQWEISDHLVSVNLVEELFRSLADFKSLEECLTDMRERITGGFVGNPHWFIPVLYLQSESGDLFASKYEKDIIPSDPMGRMNWKKFVEPILTRLIPLGQSGGGDIHKGVDFLRGYRLSGKTKIVDAVFRDYQAPLLIFGDSGSGKSTLLQWLEAQSREYGWEPHLIPLIQWNNPNWELQDCPPMKEALIRLREGNKILLLLDGLNEIPQKDKVIKMRNFLDSVRHGHSTSQLCIVFTTRKQDAYFWEDIHTTKYQIEPFQMESDKGIEEYLNKCIEVGDLTKSGKEKLLELLEQDTSLRELAGIPQYLDIIVEAFTKYSGQMTEFPRHKGGIFQIVVENKLKEEYEQEQKEGRPTLPPSEKMRFLSLVAMHKMVRGVDDVNISREEIGRLLDNVINIMTENSFKGRGNFLNVETLRLWREKLSELWHCSFFKQVDSETYRFVHPIFQEYFAGVFFVELFEKELPTHIRHPRRRQEVSEWLLQRFLSAPQLENSLLLASGIVSEELLQSMVRVLRDAEEWLPPEDGILMAAKILANGKPFEGLRRTTHEIYTRLLEHLEHPSTFYFGQAVNCFTTLFERKSGEIGDIESQAVDKVISLMRDEQKKIRQAATIAVKKSGSSVWLRYIQPLLENENEKWQVRANTALLIGELGDSSHVPALQQSLRHPEWEVRQEAVEAIGKLCSPLEVLTLLPLLSDEDWHVRDAAKEVLEQLEGVAEVPILFPLLEKKQDSIREVIEDAKAVEGGNAGLSSLFHWLKNEDGDVRAVAVWAIGLLGGADDVLELQSFLTDEHAPVRALTAWAIGRRGRSTELSSLFQMLESDRDGDVRAIAIWAIRRLGSPVDLQRLLQWLDDKNGNVRKATIEAINKLDNSDHLPKLYSFLGEEAETVWQVRKAATEAIGQLGSAADVPMLLQSLDDSTWQVREAAVKAIGQLAHSADPDDVQKLLQKLLLWLSDPNWLVRKATIEAISKLCSSVHLRPLHVPVLLHRLDKQSENNWEYNWAVREEAVRAIKKIGHPLDVLKLLSLLEDEDGNVRAAATESIASIIADEVAAYRLETEHLDDELAGVLHVARNNIMIEKSKSMLQLNELFSHFCWAMALPSFDKLPLKEKKWLSDRIKRHYAFFKVISESQIQKMQTLIEQEKIEALEMYAHAIEEFYDSFEEGLVPFHRSVFGVPEDESPKKYSYFEPALFTLGEGLRLWQESIPKFGEAVNDGDKPRVSHYGVALKLALQKICQGRNAIETRFHRGLVTPASVLRKWYNTIKFVFQKSAA